MNRPDRRMDGADIGRCGSGGRIGTRVLGNLGAQHSHDNHGDVVGTAPQVGQIDQRPGRFGRRQAAQNHADFVVFYLAREAVAAQQKGVAGLDRIGPLQIDLHRRVRPQRPGDDVFGDVAGQFAIGRSGPPRESPKPGCGRRSTARCGCRGGDRRGCRPRGPPGRRRAAAPARWRSCPCRENRGSPARGRGPVGWRREWPREGPPAAIGPTACGRPAR